MIDLSGLYIGFPSTHMKKQIMEKNKDLKAIALGLSLGLLMRHENIRNIGDTKIPIP